MGKTVWMGIGMITASLLACQNEELEYYPIEKKHLSSTYKCNFLGADNKQ